MTAPLFLWNKDKVTNTKSFFLKGELMNRLYYIKRSISFFYSSRRRIAAIILIFVASTGISMILPFITQGLIDKGFAEKDFFAILKYALSFFGFYLAFSLLNILKESVRLKIYNDVKYSLRELSLKHLLSIHMDYYSSNNPANIYQFLEEDINGISGIVGEETLAVVSSFLIAVGGCVSLCKISWKLSLLLVVYIPIKYIVTRFLAIRNAILTKNYIDKAKDYSEWFGDLINGIKEIRFFNLNSTKINDFSEKQKNVLDSNYRKTMLACINEETQTMLIQTLMTAIYISSGIILLKDGISLGSIIAFEAYALMIVSPVSDALNIIFNVSSLMPSIIRFFTFIDEKEETEGTKTECTDYDICFHDVSFSYDNSKMILKDVSFKIPYGEKVAVIGNNGVGKTTLVNLILRAIMPSQGKIEIGEANIWDYKLSFYRSLISIVSQNIFLFNDTVYNNICLGKKISDEYYKTIVKTVNLNSFLEEKSSEYLVGQNGALLSGGQKQKIAIARAIVQQSPILILDEATSNLDNESIEMINKLIFSYLKDSTIICISHEDKIISRFDRVLRITDGVVNEKCSCCRN